MTFSKTIALEDVQSEGGLKHRLSLGPSVPEEKQKANREYRVEIVWQNVAKFVILHGLAVWGLFRILDVSLYTISLAFLTFMMSTTGITAGSHRLWTHRAYKARLPLKIYLAFAISMASENSILVWSRDHRVHHKYSETNADPHNANRGFFFAHIGWLMCRKHPEVFEKGSKIDLSDLTSDPVVMFQHKHYLTLSFLCCIFLPTLIPHLLWNETLLNGFLLSVLRYVCVLHVTWLVNSAAHLWGERPYDVHVNPAENLLVSLFSNGEGFHNYHHTFPQDYSASEWRYSFNFTTLFIDVMAWLGQAYDRKMISQEMVVRRKERTGLGTSPPKR